MNKNLEIGFTIQFKNQGKSIEQNEKEIISSLSKIDTSKLKTLIAFDYSGSINGSSNYFSNLKRIIDTYYNNSRGDKFYRWGSTIAEVSYSKMMDIIKNKVGKEGTSSHLIAEIINKERENGFKHLIIVTDGMVCGEDLRHSDDLLKKYNVQLDFVTIYIINTSGNCDLSVCAPYCKYCPNKLIYIDQNGEEHLLKSLTEENLKTFDNNDRLINEHDFLHSYDKIEDAVKNKIIGNSYEIVNQKLLDLKAKVENSSQAKGEELVKDCLSEEVLEVWINIEGIISEYDFLYYYDKIEAAVKAKTLRGSSGEVREKLLKLKAKVVNPSKKFLDKWNKLYQLIFMSLSFDIN